MKGPIGPQESRVAHSGSRRKVEPCDSLPVGAERLKICQENMNLQRRKIFGDCSPSTTTISVKTKPPVSRFTITNVAAARLNFYYARRIDCSVSLHPTRTSNPLIKSSTRTKNRQDARWCRGAPTRGSGVNPLTSSVNHLLVNMSNVLSEDKEQQVIALGKLGWPLRRIEQATGVRRYNFYAVFPFRGAI